MRIKQCCKYLQKNINFLEDFDGCIDQMSVLVNYQHPVIFFLTAITSSKGLISP